jgi:glycosyltransferase involved in cell wall biosynthesis
VRTRGGPADILDDGETGWLIAPDNSAALADAMVAAVNDPAARVRMGKAARREALRSYAWEPIGARLADVVRDSVDASVKPHTRAVISRR